NSSDLKIILSAFSALVNNLVQLLSPDNDFADVVATLNLLCRGVGGLSADDLTAAKSVIASTSSSATSGPLPETAAAALTWPNLTGRLDRDTRVYANAIEEFLNEPIADDETAATAKSTAAKTTSEEVAANFEYADDANPTVRAAVLARCRAVAYSLGVVERLLECAKSRLNCLSDGGTVAVSFFSTASSSSATTKAASKAAASLPAKQLLIELDLVDRIVSLGVAIGAVSAGGAVSVKLIELAIAAQFAALTAWAGRPDSPQQQQTASSAQEESSASTSQATADSVALISAAWRIVDRLLEPSSVSAADGDGAVFARRNLRFACGALGLNGAVQFMLGRQTQQTQQHQLLLGPAGLLAVSRSLKALLDSPSLLLTGANSAESSASSSVADLRPLDAYHSPERLRGLLANVASCQCLLELLDLYLRSALETASQQLQAPQPRQQQQRLASALSSASVAFHRCLHSLLTECPTGQTDQFRSSLSAAVGFPIDASNQPLPLRSSWRSLSVAVQVIFLRLEAGRSTGAEDRKLLDSLWLRLFASLSTGWLARNAELLYTWPNQLASSGSGASDLGPEVAQLMQLLFFARQQRREALNLTVNLFCQLVSSVPKKPTQLLNPLPISRLCLLMASFVQYYYDPPDNLMRQLKYSFFGQFLRPTSSQATVAAATAADSASCGTLAAVASDEDLANRLLYYELPPVPAPSVSKPDNLALDCLMSNPDTYDQIYSACLGLLRLTWRVNALSNNSTADYRPDSMRALEYHWRAANRLLNLLPPSGWFLRTCDSGGLEPPSGDILADRFDLYCVAQLNSRYFTARRQVFANLAKSTGQAWIDALFEEKLSACGTLAALTAYVESYFKDVKFGEFTNNSSCGNPLPVAMLDAAVACLSAIFSDLRSGGEGGDDSESTASSSRRLVSASGGKVVALAKLSSADTPASVLACANRLRQPLIDIAELCGQAIIDWLVQTDSQHCGLADYELQLCRRLLAILSGPGGFKDSSACLPEHIRRNMDVYDALDGRGCQQQSGSTPAHSLMEQTVLLHLAQSSATGPA
uniref:E3_UBR4_N domain-containing protein n=1 Tax=Macrostomum lignano TaxID=282301 RepID=A0A1I8HP39_9PLAT